MTPTEPLTPSETKTLKMFDELFDDKNICCGGDFHQGIEHLRLEEVRAFLLTQLRLARADERKKAYEEGQDSGRNQAYAAARGCGYDSHKIAALRKEWDELAEIESARKA